MISDIIWKYGPNALSISGALLSAGGTLWKSLSDAAAKSKERDSSRFPAIIIAFGALIVIAGSYWTFQAQLRSSEENRHLQQQLLDASAKEMSLSSKLAEKSDEIADLNRALSKKSDQLAKKSDDLAVMSKELRLSVLGNGMCFVAAAPTMTRGSDMLMLTLINTSDYPIYAIHVVLEDQAKRPPTVNGRSNQQWVLDSQETIDVPVLAPKQRRVLKMAPSGELVKTRAPIDPANVNDDILRLNISITTLSGSFSELLRLKREASGWADAVRITDSQGKVLKEYISLPFYRDVRGRPTEFKWE